MWKSALGENQKRTVANKIKYQPIKRHPRRDERERESEKPSRDNGKRKSNRFLFYLLLNWYCRCWNDARSKCLVFSMNMNAVCISVCVFFSTFLFDSTSPAPLVSYFIYSHLLCNFYISIKQIIQQTDMHIKSNPMEWALLRFIENTVCMRVCVCRNLRLSVHILCRSHNDRCLVIPLYSTIFIPTHLFPVSQSFYCSCDGADISVDIYLEIKRHQIKKKSVIDCTHDLQKLRTLSLSLSLWQAIKKNLHQETGARKENSQLVQCCCAAASDGIGTSVCARSFLLKIHRLSNYYL